MPKTNLTVLMAGANWDYFRKEIKKRMIELDYSSYEPVAKKMGVAPASLRNWMKDPGQFRMNDLAKMLDVLKISGETRIWYFNEVIEQLNRQHKAS